MLIMSGPVPAAGTADAKFAAFVAIDWAGQKHCWKLLPVDSGRFEPGEMQNTPEAMQVWAAELNRRFQGRRIAVAVEQRRGPVVCRLSQYPHLVLYPVHPTTLARFREAFFPSGSKGDPGDTGLLLDILLHHRDHSRRLDPDTPETRLLQMLVEQRRRLVNEKTRHSNRLTAWLKMYFPQALDWIDDIDSSLGLDFLERWPTLEQLQRTKPNTLHRFFVDHHSRSQERIRARIQAIYPAVPATTDPAMLTAGPAIAAGLVEQLKVVQAAITALDQGIEAAVATHPEAPLFAGLPGAGPALRPRLIVAFGAQRDRYASAEELQAYSGIGPVQHQSGNSCATYFRRACPKFWRQTFMSLRATPWPNPAGRAPSAPSMTANGRKARAITPPSALWPLNGFGFSSGVGRTARLTMRALICSPSKGIILRSAESWDLPPAPSGKPSAAFNSFLWKTLDGIAQMSPLFSPTTIGECRNSRHRLKPVPRRGGLGARRWPRACPTRDVETQVAGR
jgi:transposase